MKFSRHQSEQGGDDDAPDAPYTSVNLDRSVEDREEATIVHEYFDGSPCCTLRHNKSACWTSAGQERFLLARQESMGLEKDLASLRAFCALTNDDSASRECVRASIKYYYGASRFRVLLLTITLRCLKQYLEL